MSFYRIYRPQVIEDIDNAAVREQLLSLLHKDKKELPHAYLFTGPKGAGKTTAARVIAKLFNCMKPTKTGPCGVCEQCTAISKGTSLDVIEMDAASNRGIDEIRVLRDRIGLSPVSSEFTIYIIDEVHMLTTEAFNALLKTLEEPPSHAVFVLATTDRAKVPLTIQSRCMSISFARATLAELTHALKRITKAEKISVTDDALTRIAEIADGSFRDAVKLLEQMSFTKGEIDAAVVDKTLARSDDATRQAFLSHLIAKDTKGALQDITLVLAAGGDMKSFITDILSDVEVNLVSAATGSPNGQWTIDSCQRVIELLTRAYSELRVSPLPHLPIELAVIEFCTQKTNSAPVVLVTPSPVMVRPAPTASTEKKMEPKSAEVSHESLGLLTLDKLVEHWPDFIIATKPYNHSVAGVLRSSRPKSVASGIVTIEAFYKFHQEKLGEVQTKQILSDVLKKLFGEKVKIEIVLGQK